MELEFKYIAGYLPYGLKGVLIHDLKSDFEECDWVEDFEIFSKGSIWTYAGYADEDLCLPLGEGEFSGFLIRNKTCYTSVGNSIKPILRPLSDYFRKTGKQVMDELNCSLDVVQEIWELTDGRKKLDQISVKTYNVMRENQIDFNRLIEAGLAADINTIEL